MDRYEHKESVLCSWRNRYACHDSQLLVLQSLASFHDPASGFIRTSVRRSYPRVGPTKSSRAKSERGGSAYRTIASCRCEDRSVNTRSVVDLFSSTCASG